MSLVQNRFHTGESEILLDTNDVHFLLRHIQLSNEDTSIRQLNLSLKGTACMQSGHHLQTTFGNEGINTHSARKFDGSTIQIEFEKQVIRKFIISLPTCNIHGTFTQHSWL
jgi:hypothetical protein